jgi:hypothetical protein
MYRDLMTIYETKARRASLAELNAGLADIRETLALWRERPLSDPYVARLYAERDCYLTEAERRHKRGRK